MREIIKKLSPVKKNSYYENINKASKDVVEFKENYIEQHYKLLS